MIDKNKQYKTRDGKEVRIYATDGVGPWSVHGAILSKNKWLSINWTPQGFQGSELKPSSNDLVEIRTRIQQEYWVNVYPDSLPDLYFTREKANQDAGVGIAACVKVVIDCEEGDGLNTKAQCNEQEGEGLD